MKRKGFTLIELLAVIVILAIIAVIATPIIIGIVENARKDAFQRSVELVVSATDININDKIYEEEYTYTITDGIISDNVAVSNTEGMNGSIRYDLEGKVEYAVHNEKYCVKKTLDMQKAEITEYNGTCGLMPETPPCFAYTEIENGIEITDYYDYENNDSSNPACPRDVIIPDTIDGVAVTKIGDSAFRAQCDYDDDWNYVCINQITSVKLPTSLESIGYNALHHNKLSGELDLSVLTSLTSIGEYAFASNEITSIKFPSSLESIGKQAFAYNKLSGELDLNNLTNLTSIGDAAFKNNNLSGEIDLSNTQLISIGELFAGDTNEITSVKFPDTLESIGESAFAYNNLSGELDLRSLTNLKSILGFDDNQITSIKFPSTLESIGESAFLRNNLSGELDLRNLTNLKSISGFGRNEITSIKFPDSIESIGDSAFLRNNLSGELDLSNLTNLTSIGDDAFEGSSDGSTNQITSIKFPNTLESIGSEAFYNNILESVTFYGRSNLDGVNLGSSVWGWVTGHDETNSIFFE